MKLYKNQTRENAKQNGFLANFQFAKDDIMSPSHIDEILSMKDGKVISKEITTYFPDTDTCEIKVYDAKYKSDGSYDFI